MSGFWLETQHTSLLLGVRAFPHHWEIGTVCPGLCLPSSERSSSLPDLPVHLVHGQATAPQPAVAAVAHEGQDGIPPSNCFTMDSEVEQAAVGHRQDCKREPGCGCELPPHSWPLLPAWLGSGDGDRGREEGGAKGGSAPQGALWCAAHSPHPEPHSPQNKSDMGSARLPSTPESIKRSP